MQNHKNPNTHLTVKERTEPSLPVRMLLKENRLQGKILDFGCGLGSDVEFIKKHNLEITAYDKYYFPDYPTEKYDTIICNYVLNVLLPEEQTQVIMEISMLLKQGGKAYFAVRRDIKKNGFIHNPKRNVTVYQCNVILPFLSLYKTEYAEIYEYQHYNVIQKSIEKPIICENATSYAIQPESNCILIFTKKDATNYFDLTERQQFSLWIMINFLKPYFQELLGTDICQITFDTKVEDNNCYIIIQPKIKQKLLIL